MGIEIENAFSAKLQSILKGLSASYRIRTAFNSYRTNVDFNGRSNTPYKIVQIATLGYSPTDWIDFSFLAAFVNAWSYEYNSFESFKFAEEISTTVTDEISLAVGHEHGGGVLKADGRTSNLEFFDSNDSQFYLSLTVSL